MKYLQLKHQLLSLSIFVVVAVFAVWPTVRARQDTPKPELITLSTGGTKRVANGRAQLWLGEPVAVPDTGGRLQQGVEFEMTCDGKTFYGEATDTSPDKSVCGCYVRLVETLDTQPPSAKLEITWTDPRTPNLQAASQAVSPIRTGK